MAKTSKNSPSLIPPEIVEALNAGTREASNLAEALAIDHGLLLREIAPELSSAELKPLTGGDVKLGISQRMVVAGGILLKRFGLSELDRFRKHRSDTVRGWAAYMIGLAEIPDFTERLEQMRPLADDPNPGVREWAWMPLRPHIQADPQEAIRRFKPWTKEKSAFLRRFGVEATRPRGVWTTHITALKENPEWGLPLLNPLKTDPEKYVQDSVSNWLNDAAKSQPDFVQTLCEQWLSQSDSPATARICKRAVRSL